MAATGKTPILLYGSTIATNQPIAGNLTNSSDGCEIAINVADKNLFFKDSTNVVNTVPIRQSSASSSGWLSSTDWSTFNGKQAALVSGTNIKTLGGTSLLGSGDITSLSMSGTVSAGNLKLDTNTLSSTNTNGNIVLDPNGTGEIQAAWRTMIYGTAAGVNSVYNGEIYLGNTATYQGRISMDAYTGNTTFYIDSTYDAAAAVIKMRLRTAGTPVEALILAGSGNVTLPTGNLVIGTSGKGIDFSVTSDGSGTATSELLADYEEGTWTPSVSATSGTITTVGAVSGYYTKVGRQVTVWATVAITTNGTGANSVNIGGLPYTPVSGISHYIGTLWNDSTAKTGASVAQPGATYLSCRYYDATYPVASGQTIAVCTTYNV